MGLLIEYLRNKRKWPKSRIELLNLAINAMFYITLVATLLHIGVAEYQCRVVMPNGDILTWDEYQSLIPNITNLTVIATNFSNCHYERVCNNILVCSSNKNIPDNPYPYNLTTK